MTNLQNKWARLSKRQRAMAGVAAVLVILVALKYVEMPDAALPLPHVIARCEQELEDERAYLKKLRQTETEQQQKTARLKSQVTPYLWEMRDKVPGAEVQSEVERVAREARVTLQTMSSQRVNEVSEHLRSTELTVNLSGSMRDISRLLGALHAAERPFYWRSCRIRALSGRAGGSVSLAGRLQVFFPAVETELLFYGD